MRTGLFTFVTAFLLGASAIQAAGLLTRTTSVGDRSGGGASVSPIFDLSSSRIAFVSHAANLVTNLGNGISLQVFVRNLSSSNTILVSVGTNGAAGRGDSLGAMFSSNGQFVVFVSEADDLVNNDTNNGHDVFVRDLASDVTHLVSVATNGWSPGSPAGSLLSRNAMISSDGRWVFFESLADGLTTESRNLSRPPAAALFLRDLESNTTALITRSLDGPQPPNGPSSLQSVAPDGNRIAFINSATDLFPGVTNSLPNNADHNVFVYDRLSNGLLHVSSSLTNFPSGYDCRHASLSENGRFVAFTLAPRNDSRLLLYRRDLEAASPVLIASHLAPGTNSAPQLSADGRYISFEDGTNVWRYDSAAGTNELVSATIGAQQSTPGVARRPMMTSDGNYIAFVSNSPEETVHQATNFQIYVRDMNAGTTRLISQATNGQPSAGSHHFALLSMNHDASLLTFDSTADNLVEGDGNLASDVFLRTSSNAATLLVSERQPTRTRESGLGHSVIGSSCVSDDGRYVVFTSHDTDLVPGDTNRLPDIFIRDLQTGTVSTPGFSTNAARFPSMAGNGRFVVYQRRWPIFSFEINARVFRFDRVTMTEQAVGSRSASGGQMAISSDGNMVAFIANGQLSIYDIAYGTNYSISAAEPFRGRDAVFTRDGAWLLFVSSAAPTPNATYGKRNLFAWNVAQQQIQPEIRLISYEGGGDVGVGGFAVSGNSRYVVFNDASVSSTLYRHDLMAGTNRVLRANASKPAVNADGTLIACDPLDSDYLLLLNTTTGEEVPVATNAVFNTPLLSDDGRLLVFGKRVAGESASPFGFQLFGRDRLLGVDLFLSESLTGHHGNAAAGTAALARDNRTVVFHSAASDLVSGDYNDKLDVFVFKLGGGDSDGDGIDDDWEIAYFNNLGGNGGQDSDGDGVRDRDEFLAGTDPTDNGSVFRVLTVSSVGNGNRQVIWTGNPTRSYRVEYKDDVASPNWTALSGTISWNGTTASIVDTTAGGSPVRYYRAVRLP